MTPVVYSRRAEDDLRSIWRFIAQDNEPAADRTLTSLLARIDQLRALPRLGPRRRDIRPTTRILVEGHYLVLYEVHPDTEDGAVHRVEIIAVVDGRRDLTELF